MDGAVAQGCVGRGAGSVDAGRSVDGGGRDVVCLEKKQVVLFPAYNWNFEHRQHATYLLGPQREGVSARCGEGGAADNAVGRGAALHGAAEAAAVVARGVVEVDEVAGGEGAAEEFAFVLGVAAVAVAVSAEAVVAVPAAPAAASALATALGSWRCWPESVPRAPSFSAPGSPPLCSPPPSWPPARRSPASSLLSSRPSPRSPVRSPACPPRS